MTKLVSERSFTFPNLIPDLCFKPRMIFVLNHHWITLTTSVLISNTLLTDSGYLLGAALTNTLTRTEAICAPDSRLDTLKVTGHVPSGTQPVTFPFTYYSDCFGIRQNSDW